MILPDFDDVPIYDGERFEEMACRAADGESLLAMLFGHFCEESPALLAAIRASFEARNLEEAYYAIHQMKGAAATIGASRLHELTRVGLDLAADEGVFEMPELVDRIQKEVTVFEACAAGVVARS